MLGAMDLSPEEIRVLGCLVEKQLTTPQQYPLSLNALTLACNQSSNRDPVVDWDESRVEAAITSAKTRGLAGFVHPSHGRSALRFRHALDDVLGLEARPLALLAVLLLRGPQTPGELRGRTERMVRFADLHEVQAELEALAQRTEPLVARLARGPGLKEDRYAQLLGGAAGRLDPATAAPPAAPVFDPAAAAVEPAGPSTDLAHLRAEVDRLRAEVDRLRHDLEDLRSELGA